MRSLERIEPFLSLLAKFWRHYPDLRFRQIVQLIEQRHPKEDIFYLEEDELTDFIESLLTSDRKNAAKE